MDKLGGGGIKKYPFFGCFEKTLHFIILNLWNFRVILQGVCRTQFQTWDVSPESWSGDVRHKSGRTCRWVMEAFFSLQVNHWWDHSKKSESRHWWHFQIPRKGAHNRFFLLLIGLGHNHPFVSFFFFFLVLLLIGSGHIRWVTSRGPPHNLGIWESKTHDRDWETLSLCECLSRPMGRCEVICVRLV